MINMSVKGNILLSRYSDASFDSFLTSLSSQVVKSILLKDADQREVR